MVVFKKNWHLNVYTVIVSIVSIIGFHIAYYVIMPWLDKIF